MKLESFNTSRYQLEIETGDRVYRIVVKDSYSGVLFADSEYRYSAFVESKARLVRLDGLFSPEFDEELPDRGGRIVSVSGRLGGPDANPAIGVRHRIYMPEDGDYFEEMIILRNLGDADVLLTDYRFGFRKRLCRPEVYGGPGCDIEHYRLIALPFRLQPDGKKHDYQLDDIYHGRFQCSEFDDPSRVRERLADRGRARSEGWAWTDGEYGLLIVKYNPEMIEYSMLETERAPDGIYLNFGGASPCLYDEPFEIRRLPPGEQAAFGQTRYQFYEGLWRQGSYLFREYMRTLGHGLPDNYDPPVNWNVLYDLGWHHNDRAALARSYNLQTLRQQAQRAKEVGCELLYLDPGWEICEGGTTWDESRLGTAESFIKLMKSEYGLKVGFRTAGRSYCDEYPGLYRRTSEGLTGFCGPYSSKPFYETCVCAPDFRDEKARRILKVAGAGMDFIMFDEFDWRGPCFDPRHGHPVPTTPGMHAEAVIELVKKVRSALPDILIEAHDPVWPWSVRYLPVYHLHGPDRTFDEIWAFEFMWDPLDDLLSGRALSLFYYNLAYDIPLYLHMNMDNDNDNCLAFWWYASTVRHLGIGGGKKNQTRYQAYAKAMKQYLALKDLYTRGEFYGIDELTHIHVLAEEGKGVVNAFNLTDTPVSRTVELRPGELGLLGDITVEGAPCKTVRGRLSLQLDIPPFSPAVIKLTST